jgi:hypothetical protein
VAQSAPEALSPTQNAITRLTACTEIKSDSERLSCFDRTASALNAAVAQREITVLDKEDVRKARRSMFGFLMPNLAAFGLGERSSSKSSAEELTLETVIRSVRSVSYGKWDIETEEQAVWRNVDLLDSAPTAGEKLHIKKGALGSFFLKAGAARAVRAQRVR